MERSWRKDYAIKLWWNVKKIWWTAKQKRRFGYDWASQRETPKKVRIGENSEQIAEKLCSRNRKQRINIQQNFHEQHSE